MNSFALVIKQAAFAACWCFFVLCGVSVAAENDSSGISGSGLQYEADGITIQSYTIAIENSDQMDAAADYVANQAATDFQSVPAGEFEFSSSYLAIPELDQGALVTPASVNRRLGARLKSKGVKVLNTVRYTLNHPLQSVKDVVRSMSMKQKLVFLHVWRVSVPGVLVFFGSYTDNSLVSAASDGIITSLIALPFSIWYDEYADFLTNFRLVKPKHLAHVKSWMQFATRNTLGRVRNLFKKGYASRVVETPEGEILGPVAERTLEEANTFALSVGTEAGFSFAITKIQEFMKATFAETFRPLTLHEWLLNSFYVGIGQNPIDRFASVYEKLQRMKGLPEEVWLPRKRAWGTLGSNLSVSSLILLGLNAGPMVDAAGITGLVILFSGGLYKYIDATRELRMLQAEMAEKQKALDAWACSNALEGGREQVATQSIDFSSEAWVGL